MWEISPAVSALCIKSWSERHISLAACLVSVKLFDVSSQFSWWTCHLAVCCDGFCITANICCIGWWYVRLCNSVVTCNVSGFCTVHNVCPYFAAWRNLFIMLCTTLSLRSVSRRRSRLHECTPCRSIPSVQLARHNYGCPAAMLVNRPFWFLSDFPFTAWSQWRSIGRLSPTFTTCLLVTRVKNLWTLPHKILSAQNLKKISTISNNVAVISRLQQPIFSWKTTLQTDHSCKCIWWT